MKREFYIGIVICMTTVSFLCFFFSVAFLNAKPTVSKEGNTAFSIRNGGDIFSIYCAACHGENGMGNGRYYASELDIKPADFTKAGVMNSKFNDYLFDFITKGSSAMGKSALCPPWGHTLVDGEIKDVIVYIRSLINN